MHVLYVAPGAVLAAARTLQALATHLERRWPAPVVGAELQDAIDEFTADWSAHQHRLAEVSREAGHAAVQAEQRYQQLERLLIPAALR